MITFLLGVLATVVVGMLVWLTIGAIKVSRKVKSMEEEMKHIWMDVESRYNSIERDRHALQEATDRRIDNTISYIDSRLDKLINEVSSKFVTKKDKFDNTVNYNN